MARRLNLHKQAGYIDVDFLRLDTFPLQSDGGPYISATSMVELAEIPTFQALGSGIYWMVTMNVVVWMVAPLVAVTVRG